MKYYTINELATITGFTTRTLRNYIKAGLLDGEKIDGVWQFDEDDLGRFLSDPNIRQGLKSKKKTQVFDFLLDEKKPDNQMCTILDLNAGKEEAEAIAGQFCDRINQLNNNRTQFSFEWDCGHTRIILSGPEVNVMQLLNDYRNIVGNNRSC